VSECFSAFAPHLFVLTNDSAVSRLEIERYKLMLAKARRSHSAAQSDFRWDRKRDAYHNPTAFGLAFIRGWRSSIPNRPPPSQRRATSRCQSCRAIAYPEATADREPLAIRADRHLGMVFLAIARIENVAILVLQSAAPHVKELRPQIHGRGPRKTRRGDPLRRSQPQAGEVHHLIPLHRQVILIWKWYQVAIGIVIAALAKNELWFRSAAVRKSGNESDATLAPATR